MKGWVMYFGICARLRTVSGEQVVGIFGVGEGGSEVMVGVGGMGELVGVAGCGEGVGLADGAVVVGEQAAAKVRQRPIKTKYALRLRVMRKAECVTVEDLDFKCDLAGV